MALSATELKNKLTETWPKQHWWTFDEQAQEFVTDAEVVFCVEETGDKYQLMSIFYVGPHGYMENVEDHNKTYDGDFETITEQIHTEAANTFQIMGYPMHWANITVEEEAVTAKTDRSDKLQLTGLEIEELIGQAFTLDSWRYDKHSNAVYSATNIEYNLISREDEPGTYEEEESYYDGYESELLGGEDCELTGTPEEVAAQILADNESDTLYGYTLKWPYTTIYIDDDFVDSPWTRLLADPQWHNAPQLKQCLAKLNGNKNEAITEVITELDELAPASPLVDLAAKAVVENCIQRGIRDGLIDWLIRIRPHVSDAAQDEIFFRLMHLFNDLALTSDNPRTDFMVTWVPKKRVPWLAERIREEIFGYKGPDFNAPYFEALDALGVGSEKERAKVANWRA